jgi:hypothetical protein
VAGDRRVMVRVGEAWAREGPKAHMAIAVRLPKRVVRLARMSFAFLVTFTTLGET